MRYVLYFLICISATTLGSISGIGGGVIIKPVMDAVSGISVSSISFLSGCTVLAMSIVSVLKIRDSDTKIESRQGTILAVGGAAGGVTGKWILVPPSLIVSSVVCAYTPRPHPGTENHVRERGIPRTVGMLYRRASPSGREGLYGNGIPVWSV